jgi:S1-C subfamily serine protease
VAGLIIAFLLAVASAPAAQPGTLKITVTIVGADGAPRPVSRHALLISDDPVTAAPQRFVTKADGTVEVPLRSGRYIVESDTPFIFAGKSYEWSQSVKVTAGSQAVLALTAANAMVETAPAGAATASSAADDDSAAATLVDWEGSVVTIWGPKTSGNGFLFDARGLIATNQRVVGIATSVEVQLSPTKKVAGRVVAADPNRNVAVLWINPEAASPARPMTLAYGEGDKAAVSEHDKIYSFEGRGDEAKTLATGMVTGVTAHTIVTDVQLDRASAGAPIFTRNGGVVAIATASDEPSVVNELSPRAVRIDDARSAISESEKKLQGAPPPAALLPVDPRRPFPEEALKAGARNRSGAVAAYLVTAADFDVSILTPPLLYAAFHQGDRERFDYGGRNPAEMQPALRALEDFGAWSDYVSETPPVVMIRVSPKLTEGFWTTVARGAAQTQGVAIPAIKRVKVGFSSLRLSCGDSEMLPIHPFRIEHRMNEGGFIDEGLYVFDPATFGPQCGTVKLTLFSEKAPDKGDTHPIDAKIVQQVWDDFAPYRAAAAQAPK